MSKQGKSAGKIGALLVFAILALPAAGLLYTQVFLFDSQFESNKYVFAFEKDGKLYMLENGSSSSAFDKGTANDELYSNDTTLLRTLIALSYDDFEIGKTGNPFFAGEILSPFKYADTELRYLSPTESRPYTIFKDRDGKEMYRFEADVEDEFAVKLRPTFPYFSKNKYTFARKQTFCNISRLLRIKYGRELRLRTDEPNKLIILSFK